MAASATAQSRAADFRGYWCLTQQPPDEKFLDHAPQISLARARTIIDAPQKTFVLSYMVVSAFARFPMVIRSLSVLMLLITGPAVTPCLAAAEPNSPGQWFVNLIATDNNKLFCIPGTTQLVDVAQAVAQYRQSHQTGQLTPPLASQILVQLYPCNGTSTATNVAVPADEGAAPVGMQTIDVMRRLQTTSGHENDVVLDQIKNNSDSYPPPVLFGLARVLFRQGNADEAIFWFNAGRLRGNFDAWRSTDVVGARAVMVALSRQMPIELRKAQFSDLQKLQAITAKVIAWDETTPRHYDRRWIDFHGVAANKTGSRDGKVALAPIPPEKWDDLAKQVREEYRKDLEKSITLMSNAKLPSQ